MQDNDILHSNDVFKEIFADLLKSGKNVRLRALGWSMHPTIKNGEYVIIKTIDYRDTKIGDIIASQNIHDKKIIIHRLVRKQNHNNSTFLATKGDNGFGKGTDTPMNPGEYIFGKVISIEKNNKVVNLESGINQLSNYLIARVSLNLPWLLIIRKKFIRGLEIPHLIPLKLYENFFRLVNRLKKD